jgi:hypothetical protein
MKTKNEKTFFNVTARIRLNWAESSKGLGGPVSFGPGDKLTVFFDPATPSRLSLHYGPRTLRIRLATAHKFVTGINKPPRGGTLQRWASDGYCKTVTGEKVEPDGWGTDGAPSWMNALGLI